uniref:Vanin C-terminal domain-containing protein n=1 Tax=Ursus maritimus TaxID=29073 RepID=A0A452VJJ3_URSMA
LLQLLLLLIPIINKVSLNILVWSGIYTPEAVQVYHYDMETESGQLMLSELKSWPRREPTYSAAVDWSAYARSVRPFLSEQSNFPGMIYFDELTFPELKRNTGNDSLPKRTDEVYALGAFDGLHTVGGQYYLQVKNASKCNLTNFPLFLDIVTCGESVGSAFTKFEEFSLGATLAVRYVFPQVTLRGSQLAPERPSEVGGIRDNQCHKFYDTVSQYSGSHYMLKEFFYTSSFLTTSATDYLMHFHPNLSPIDL